jgi:hypothetical protein
MRREAGVSPACHAGIPTGIPQKTSARTPAWQPKRPLHGPGATICRESISRISCAALHQDLADPRLSCGELITHHLTDSRPQRSTQLPLANLLRQSGYSRMAGYEAVAGAQGPETYS